MLWARAPVLDVRQDGEDFADLGPAGAARLTAGRLSRAALQHLEPVIEGPKYALRAPLIIERHD